MEEDFNAFPIDADRRRTRIDREPWLLSREHNRCAPAGGIGLDPRRASAREADHDEEALDPIVAAHQNDVVTDDFRVTARGR
jgi:hypothetical protein